jgi:hypothetical protein
LFGIELLLFFEDLEAGALAAFLESLMEVRARLLVAPRLMAAAAFLEALELFEELFVRVFCDTACARETTTPLFVFSREPMGPITPAAGFG